MPMLTMICFSRLGVETKPTVSVEDTLIYSTTVIKKLFLQVKHLDIVHVFVLNIILIFLGLCAMIFTILNAVYSCALMGWLDKDYKCCANSQGCCDASQGCNTCCVVSDIRAASYCLFFKITTQILKHPASSASNLLTLIFH